MSAAEIAEAQAEIRAKLRPDTIAFLKRRGREKLLRSYGGSTPSTVCRIRFSLEGAAVGWLSNEELQQYPDDAQRALQRDPLRQDEGSVATVQSYTLKEAMALVSSPVQAQRLAGLQILQSALMTAVKSPDEEIQRGELKWRAVWDWAVFELEILRVLKGCLREAGVVSVQRRAFVILSELTVVPPTEMAVINAQWQLPLTGWPIPAAALEKGPLDLAAKLKEEMADGLLDAIKTALTRETLPLVLQFFMGCSMRASELSEAIMRAPQLLKTVKDLSQQCEALSERWLFIRCLCCLVESHPAALDTLADHGWLEVVSCALGTWTNSALTSTSPDDEMQLLEMFLRCCRVCRVLQRPLFSMADLFGSYFLLLSSPLQKESARAVAREVFLGFSAEMELQLSQKCHSTELSAACLLSVKQTAMEWLELSQDISDWSLGAAVILFLADYKAWSKTEWTPEEASIMNGLLVDWGSAECLIESDPATLAWLTSLLKLLDVDAELSKTHKAFIRALLERTKNWSPSVDPLLQTIQLQSMSHFANYATALLHVVTTQLQESFPIRSVLELSIRALTLMPPSYEAHVLYCFAVICTSPVFQSVISEVFSALEPLPEGYSVSSAASGELLLEGLAATWCDLLPESHYSHQGLPQSPTTQPLHFSSCTLRSGTATEESKLPLLVDFLLSPLTSAPSWLNSQDHPSNDSEKELQQLQSQFLLWIYLEIESIEVVSVSAGRKLKGWIRLLFLRQPGALDVSTDPLLQHAFTFVVNHQLQSIPLETLFQGWEAHDVEPLLDAFIETGDRFLATVLSLLFLRAAPEKLKSLTWQKLAHNRLLHLLPSQEYWFGSPELYTLDKDSTLRQLVAEAWERGDLKKAQKFHSGAFQWVQHILKQ